MQKSEYKSHNEMKHEFDNPVDALRYVMAGHSYPTLVSKKTGTRYTYRIVRPDGEPPESEFRFVAVLTGPDNENSFSYMGVHTKDSTLRPTAKTKVGPDASSWLPFVWTLQHLQAGKLPKQLEIWHEGHCGKCGAKLTVPESIASGLGPVCKRKKGV